MKKALLLFGMVLGLSIAPAHLHAQVNVAPNLNGNIPGFLQLPGASALAGHTIANPGHGIPNGATIVTILNTGEVDYYVGNVNNTDVVVFMNIMISDFMLSGMMGTGTTLSPMNMATVTAGEQTALTLNPPPKPGPDLETYTGPTVQINDTFGGLVYFLSLMTNGKITYVGFGGEVRDDQAPYSGLHQNVEQVFNNTDNHAAVNEAPPTEVPVVGDLGGQVEEIL